MPPASLLGPQRHRRAPSAQPEKTSWHASAAHLPLPCTCSAACHARQRGHALRQLPGPHRGGRPAPCCGSARCSRQRRPARRRRAQPAAIGLPRQLRCAVPRSRRAPRPAVPRPGRPGPAPACPRSRPRCCRRPPRTRCPRAARPHGLHPALRYVTCSRHTRNTPFSSLRCTAATRHVSARQDAELAVHLTRHNKPSQAQAAAPARGEGVAPVTGGWLQVMVCVSSACRSAKQAAMLPPANTSRNRSRKATAVCALRPPRLA